MRAIGLEGMVCFTARSVVHSAEEYDSENNKAHDHPKQQQHNRCVASALFRGLAHFLEGGDSQMKIPPSSMGNTPKRRPVNFRSA